MPEDWVSTVCKKCSNILPSTRYVPPLKSIYLCVFVHLHFFLNYGIIYFCPKKDTNTINFVKPEECTLHKKNHSSRSGILLQSVITLNLIANINDTSSVFLTIRLYLKTKFPSNCNTKNDAVLVLQSHRKEEEKNWFRYFQNIYHGNIIKLDGMADPPPTSSNT